MNSNIRITGGICRGRAIESFEGDRTRPTSSMVRQAVFNILGVPSELSVLDLYAGTGSMGLEALSRGAREVVWVESHRPTSDLIRKNQQKLSLAQGTVICDSVENYLASTQQTFDWVFVDPPFVNEYPTGLDFKKLVKPEGIIIFQYPTKQRILWQTPPHKTYKYGESSIGILYCDP